jgi:DNA-binding ferritin-like protein (Dps family)
MVKEELIRRSPLRILEKAIHGGLKDGNIGVLASRKGIGKTACLVHISTDKLFQNKPVIHVSYASRVDYIITWYEDIFKEIAKKRQLESAVEVHDDIIRNRVIMNFKQDAAHTDQVLKTIGAMIDCADFIADTIMVDGYDFRKSTAEDLQKFKDFAKKMGLRIWFSASLKADDPLFDDKGIPHELKGYLDHIDVLITLEYQGEHVRLSLVKDFDNPPPGDLKIKLDPKTLLISE